MYSMLGQMTTKKHTIQAQKDKFSAFYFQRKFIAIKIHHVVDDIIRWM